MGLRHVITAIYTTLFAGALVLAGVFFWQTRLEYKRHREIEAQTRQRLAEAETRLAEQEKILERLRRDPVFVEMEIRRRLGYARQDETIFRFPE
ncbi:Septum formation initiator [Opitutaceae bacterium TAV1]|nr:septum formation initiator [Opitutaceae bacterium TAV5]EIP97532.1 Septum formation initiator [Opitutaceae bacterium TAV1]